MSQSAEFRITDYFKDPPEPPDDDGGDDDDSGDFYIRVQYRECDFVDFRCP